MMPRTLPRSPFDRPYMYAKGGGGESQKRDTRIHTTRTRTRTYIAKDTLCPLGLLQAIILRDYAPVAG